MKGIMFSDELIPMVLDGSKTMTRRIMKEQPIDAIDGVNNPRIQPRYRVGETVYVKEAWSVVHRLDSVKQSELPTIYGGEPLKIDYCADGVYTGKRRNKMFMPEWASRCKLEITGVRAERLQDISAEDAIKEGVSTNLREHDAVCDLRAKFSNLIDRINGVGAWDSNHWVWVYEFRRVS
jgi:uncharacterized protein YhfF